MRHVLIKRIPPPIFAYISGSLKRLFFALFRIVINYNLSLKIALKINFHALLLSNYLGGVNTLFLNRYFKR